MKIFKYVIIPFVALFVISCVKETLYDPVPVTPVPEENPQVDDDSLRCKVIIYIDWEGLEGKSDVGSFKVRIGDESAELAVGEQPDTFFVKPGAYDVYVHNTPSGIVFNNGIASMSVDGDGDIVAKQLNPLFSGSMDVAATFDMISQVSVKPVLCMRELDILMLDVFDSPELVSVELSNVAKSFNMKTEKVENVGTNLKIVDNIGDSISHVHNLFGFVSGTQILSFHFTFPWDAAGKKGRIDIGQHFSDFNDNRNYTKFVEINYNDLIFDSSKQGKKRLMNKNIKNSKY